MAWQVFVGCWFKQGSITLGRRLRKFALTGFAMLVLVTFVVLAAFWWRLSEGPVSLAFLKDTVEQRINASMPEVEVSLDNVVVMRDEKTGQPRLRLQDIKFRDRNGRLIAQAPHAAIALKGSALLRGDVVPQGLELIGTRLLIQRSADGSIGLGFGSSSAAQKFGDSIDRKTDTKDSDTDIFEGVEFLTTQAANLVDFLDGESIGKKETSALTGLEKLNSVRITKTAITLYDQSNGAVWHSPDASLVFRRTSYGFAMFVDGNIAARETPWRIELTAHYRNATRRFKVSSRVFDVIPAELARDVFALSELAQVKLPLSGHVEAEFTREGKMTQVSAEFSAAAGRVGFPGYISQPIIIDEGLLRLDLDPATGDIVIGNSAIFVGGSQAQLTGRVKPVRDQNGRLAALDIVLNANNVRIDASGTVKNPAMFDTVRFDGVASIEKARLLVNDLILMSGAAGIRIRGQFIKDSEAVGVYLAGSIRDLPAATIKKMWPPVVARGAREWITENVVSGKMTKGAFRVAIPGTAIVAAGKDIAIPDDMVDFKFSLADVTSRYFKQLPLLTKASGTAVLTGDHFVLNVNGGQVTLPNKKVIKLQSAVMKSRGLATKITPSTITVKTSADAADILSFINQEPLSLLDRTSVNLKNLSGKATVKVDMDLPLSRNMREDEVSVRATALWKNGTFKQPIAGVDLTAGEFQFIVDDKAVSAKGKALVNGLPAALEWKQPFTKNRDGNASLVLKTTLTENKRTELGVDLSRFVRGSVGVKVTAGIRGGQVKSARVETDLSHAILALDEIDWVHPAGKKTRAVFNFQIGKDTNKIDKLLVTGGNMKITGSLLLDKKGNLRKAIFPRFTLDKTNDMSLTAGKKGNEIDINVKGKSFDGRKMINQSFSSASRQSNKKEGTATAVRLRVNVDNVLTNRGELVKNVQGEVYAVNGFVERANIRGQFVGGSPVSLQVVKSPGRGRDLVLVSRDAGAALRAANLYSKVSGGTLSLKANLASRPRSGIDKGLLVMRHFLVRNEAAFTTIGNTANKRAKLGPRKSGQAFKKLKLPFSTDRQFVNIGDALIKGSDLGASANGRIRKSDGAMDVAGTIIPAYALNAAVGDVPLLGALLTGGKGQGVFGLTYALQGTMKKPKFIVNPVSAIAPGFLRNLFAIGGGGNVGSDGTGHKKVRKLKDDSDR